MPKYSAIQITDQLVHQSQPSNSRYEIRDSKLTGLLLRVSPNGRKSWYVQLDRNRKRKIADASLLNTSLARYRARDMLIRDCLASGEQPRNMTRQTLGTFLTGPYTSRKSRQSSYAKRDTKRLSNSLGDLAMERLDQIGVSKLEHWRMRRRRVVSDATVNRELSMLRTAFDLALEEGLVLENPARMLRLSEPAGPKKPRMLHPNERSRLEAVLTEREDRVATLVKLALNTGMRRKELFRLRWKDVYFGPFPSVIVEKSKSHHHNRGRRIPLNSTASESLLLWRERQKVRNYLVFPSPSGGPLQSISTSWSKLMKDASINGFTLNDCRDDFACRLVSAGAPLNQVRDLLGHSSILLTEKYAHLAPGQPSSAVALLDSKSDTEQGTR